MNNLRPDDSVIVQEALLAGADFRMLGAVHALHTTCMEIANTGKMDLVKIEEMGNLLATVPDFKENLEKNLRAFFK